MIGFFENHLLPEAAAQKKLPNLLAFIREKLEKTKTYRISGDKLVERISSFKLLAVEKLFIDGISLEDLSLISKKMALTHIRELEIFWCNEEKPQDIVVVTHESFVYMPKLLKLTISTDRFSDKEARRLNLYKVAAGEPQVEVMRINPE